MRSLLALIGFLAVVVAVAAAVFFFGGFFDVAGTAKDPAIVDWAILKVREASIARHASGTPPVPLEDPAVIQAGARAFATRGCVYCHGGPGAEWAKFSEGMNPSPPDLKEVAGAPPAQLFFVIKNGIKMTGMPGFGPVGVDDKEIWSIAAFIKKLPAISDADYKAWTAAQ